MWYFYSYLSRIKLKYSTSLHLFFTKSTKYYGNTLTKVLTKQQGKLTFNRHFSKLLCLGSPKVFFSLFNHLMEFWFLATVALLWFA